MFVKDGLEHANTVQTPASDDMSSEYSELLDQKQFRKCRSQLTDVYSLVKIQRTNLKSHAGEVAETRQVLKRRKAVWQVFSYDQMSTEGDNILRPRLGRLKRNTNVLKCMRDTVRHLHVAHNTRTQKIIARRARRQSCTLQQWNRERHKESCRWCCTSDSRRNLCW